MLYEQRFQKVHQLLKNHGCKSTFSFEKEYQSPVVLGGYNFYKPEEEMHNDNARKEWEEEVDAKLDVCVPTKKAYSKREEIRFDIKWSKKAKLYSMFVSLPTSSRSISLSLKRFKTQEELMGEVEIWLSKAGCKKVKKIGPKKPKVEKFGQMALI